MVAQTTILGDQVWPAIIWPGQPLSNPALYPVLKVKKRRMNFQEQEDILHEPWWVTVMGCVRLAVLYAFALIAV